MVDSVLRGVPSAPRFVYGTRWSRPTPKPLSDALNAIAGFNLYGQPRLRVIWGGERKAWIGGKFEGETDKHGNLLPAYYAMVYEPKYWGAIEKWVLEAWFPPDKIADRPDWSEDELGPYPSMGDYEMLTAIPPVEFSPLRIAKFAGLIESSKLSSIWTRKNAAEERHAQKERAFDSKAQDILDDATPAFGGFTHAVVPRTFKGV